MGKRIRSRSFDEQSELTKTYADAPLPSLIYNEKKGKVNPDSPLLLPTSDRKNIRLNPTGKGTPRKDKKYHNVTLDDGENVVLGKIDRGTLPEHLVNHKCEDTSDLSNRIGENPGVAPTKVSHDTISVFVLFQCGHSGDIVVPAYDPLKIEHFYPEFSAKVNADNYETFIKAMAYIHIDMCDVCVTAHNKKVAIAKEMADIRGTDTSTIPERVTLKSLFSE